MKKIEKYMLVYANGKKARVVKLISDKVELRAKDITRDKKRKVIS